MKYIKLICTLLIEVPLFYLGYFFEALWSAFGAGRTAYVNKLMNDDEVGEFLKWKKETPQQAAKRHQVLSKVLDGERD